MRAKQNSSPNSKRSFKCSDMMRKIRTMVDLHPEHARAVLDDLPIGVVLIDRDGRVSWINRYATNFLGGDADQVLGHEIAALPLPFAPLAGVDDEPQVQVDGAMIGITQRYEHAAGEGSILIILDRGHALVWFLNALSTGASDTVTDSGVLSRGAIINRLEAEVSRSRRYANPLSCITVQLGKEAERALVGEIARNVKGQLRWVDLLGQWNDETLLLVLPETDEFAARALSEKLLSSVSLIICSSRVAVPADLGTSSWARGDNAERLVRRALAHGRSVQRAAADILGA